MKYLISCLVFQVALFTCFGQNHVRLSIYLLPEVSQTLADRTKANNETGLGIGMQAIWRASPAFSPFVQVSDDFIFYDDKVYRTNPDGSEQLALGNVVKALAGANINLIGGLHISLAAGAGFTNGQTLFTIKPGLGLFLGKNRRLLLKTDYVNMLNRYSGERQNYQSLVFSLGFRLF